MLLCKLKAQVKKGALTQIVVLRKLEFQWMYTNTKVKLMQQYFTSIFSSSFNLWHSFTLEIVP